jgi:glycosyltransferase involved in cell wall biosynthesis/predicted O-methyltransferase YrrM
MRILWVSNAPWASTGYGVQTRLFVPRLRAAGHEVAVLAFYGLEGGPIVWNGIPCLPRGRDPVGLDVIGHHSDSWQADLVITLVDAWAIDPQRFAGHGIRWVPWFPVDMEPLPPPVHEKVRQAFAPIVFSRFGERMAGAAGLDPLYVPHGVDTKALRPLPQQQARRFLGMREDAFLVGMVAANKDMPSRKALPQVLEAFARFCRRRPDAMLYLHAARGDEPWWKGMGADLNALIRHFGIEKHVVGANAYNLLMGCPDEYLANAYSALDALLSPSLGEGFGVPILEAQACGCPVLVGDWTAMPELCFAGHRIPRERSEPFWTPLNSFQRLPHVDAIASGLEDLYQRRGDDELRTAARAGALAYDADLVTKTWWKPALAQLDARVRGQEPVNRKAALLVRELARAPEGPAVEIGSLRSPREVPTDGFSTLHLARMCARTGRSFASFDTDPEVVATANAVLAREQVPHRVVCRDGTEALRAAGPVAFLYLDSSDDPQDSLQQFLAAALLPDAVVVVDDAQPGPGTPHGKASELVPLLARRGCQVEFVPTEPGYLALVFRVPGGKAAGTELDVVELFALGGGRP